MKTAAERIALYNQLLDVDPSSGLFRYLLARALRPSEPGTALGYQLMAAIGRWPLPTSTSSEFGCRWAWRQDSRVAYTSAHHRNLFTYELDRPWFMATVDVARTRLGRTYVTDDTRVVSFVNRRDADWCAAFAFSCLTAAEQRPIRREAVRVRQHAN